MAIYGRFGEVVRIVRLGTLDDVRALDNRTPDKTDRDAIASGSYVVTELARPTKDRAPRLHHIAFLRADGGSAEITRAIAALTGPAMDGGVMREVAPLTKRSAT